MSPTGGTASFEDAISDLKRGSALLVVGDVPDDAHRRSCGGLLGADPDGARERIVVRTGGTCSDVGPGAPGEPGTRVLEWTAPTRGATTADSPSAPGPAPGPDGDRREYDSLRALVAATLDAVDDSAEGARADGPDALRVCIDSLVPLLGEADEATVFRFLHGVTGLVRDASGICHAHLPVAADHRSVDTLAPLFDATVELDTVEGAVRQRWRVTDPPVTSDWLPLTGTLSE